MGMLTLIENFRTVAEGLHSSASVAALVVGGYWAYHRFIKQNENFPRIKFEVDLHFVGEVQDCWLVDVIAHIDNKGLVPIQIPKMHFALFGLSETDPLDETDESLSRNLKFPHAIKKADWHNWTSTFIEPGVSTRYTHIATVPKKYKFLLLHGKFEYDQKDEFHTADKVVQVPCLPDSVTLA